MKSRLSFDLWIERDEHGMTGGAIHYSGDVRDDGLRLHVVSDVTNHVSDEIYKFFEAKLAS